MQTTIDGPDILITWDPTADNGAVILSYTVLIKQNDELYSEDTINCNGSTDPDIVNNRECRVPLVRIILDPYLL